MNHDFNFILVEELENIIFVISEGWTSRVKRKIHKLLKKSEVKQIN